MEYVRKLELAIATEQTHGRSSKEAMDTWMDAWCAFPDPLDGSDALTRFEALFHARMRPFYEERRQQWLARQEQS